MMMIVMLILPFCQKKEKRKEMQYLSIFIENLLENYQGFEELSPPPPHPHKGLMVAKNARTDKVRQSVVLRQGICNRSSGQNNATLAFELAKGLWNKKRTFSEYSKDNSREWPL